MVAGIGWTGCTACEHWDLVRDTSREARTAAMIPVLTSPDQLSYEYLALEEALSVV